MYWQQCFNRKNPDKQIEELKEVIALIVERSIQIKDGDTK
jgi:hypothetical protein